MRLSAIISVLFLAACTTTPPKYGWKQHDTRAFTLTATGEHAAIRWTIDAGAGAKLRADVTADTDVAMTDGTTKAAGSQFAAEFMQPTTAPLTLTVADNRPADAPAIANAIVNATARERLTAANKVRVTLSEWECITCP